MVDLDSEYEICIEMSKCLEFIKKTFMIKEENQYSNFHKKIFFIVDDKTATLFKVTLNTLIKCECGLNEYNFETLTLQINIDENEESEEIDVDEVSFKKIFTKVFESLLLH
ncbi:hypothetical protein EDEG_02377 [Edhazardia aedis USNM 41457]|uniref:Uncharacterized protein n=1 Tax=Edhazardia aedis (strain USNM 41457) TaxID=1003232 RepID=J9DPI4_EDHAE|nr:hypothetical protein EDEG_02377 [Edhazardia aedis USNM 41457]|eukprot:EJW03262.1 hypothetical protein EDEG_02377 [Edhazardia aedis USNM 41457]